MTGRDLEAALELVRRADLPDRCRGVEALGALEGREATEALAGLLEEASWYLRDRVVEALGERPGADDAILRVVREGSWFARVSACDVLGARGELGALSDLLAQVEDRNVFLQKSAVKAIRRLAGRNGDREIARGVAALPPGSRRRVIARIRHQAPDWAAGLERALEALPGSAFGEAPAPEPVPGVGGRERAEVLRRFRKWLAGLPARSGTGSGE